MNDERYGLVDADGVVVNVLVWDAKSEYDPPEGFILHALHDAANIGDTVDDAGRVTARATPAPDAVADAVAVLQAQADPDVANPSDADFKAAVATILLDKSAS